MKYVEIWRDPPKQSNLYPKLMVADNFMTGSINIRDSRLSLWAIVSAAISDGWDEVEGGWAVESRHGFTESDLIEFLYNLLEQRGEFGRLLLLLADAERLHKDGWWNYKVQRKKVMKQLQNCIDCLKEMDK